MAGSLGDNHLGDKCSGGDHLEKLSPEEANSGSVTSKNVYPGDDCSGDKYLEHEHLEDGHLEEEQLSGSERPESEYSVDEEEENVNNEEWYKYLGIDAPDDNSKDNSDSDYDWDDDDEERTFPKFMKLPPGIRMMIWRKALPNGRILRTAPPSEDIEQWGLPREMFAPEILNPGLAGVCWESRSFIIRFGYERLWDTSYPPGYAICEWLHIMSGLGWRPFTDTYDQMVTRRLGDEELRAGMRYWILAESYNVFHLGLGSISHMAWLNRSVGANRVNVAMIRLRKVRAAFRDLIWTMADAFFFYDRRGYPRTEAEILQVMFWTGAQMGPAWNFMVGVWDLALVGDDEQAFPALPMSSSYTMSADV
ncbi:hypothetical protein GGR51DRAFT_578615 [Nemania sp. FL0031]|nr:hypothetical protein GGR51DRAFT_578615 [Nemania sp. FL0031]